jgi:hypothetical protein
LDGNLVVGAEASVLAKVAVGRVPNELAFLNKATLIAAHGRVRDSRPALTMEYALFVPLLAMLVPRGIEVEGRLV